MFLPPGTYLCDGLTWKHKTNVVGDGRETSILKLPSGSTTPILQAEDIGSGNDWLDGQIEDIGFDGTANTQSAHGVDMSTFSGSRNEHFVLRNVKFVEMDRGVNITQANNRRPHLKHCYFENCAEGVHVSETSHPWFTDCEFRGCTTGIATGSGLFDAQVENCRFVRCTDALTGGHEHTGFHSCRFFENDRSASAGHNCIFDGCFFGGNTKSQEYAIQTSNYRVQVVGCRFVTQASGGWTNGAINTKSSDSLVVTGCVFECQQGPAIASTQHGSFDFDLDNSTISGNYFRGGFAPMIRIADPEGGTPQMNNSVVSNNMFHVTGDVSSTELIKIAGGSGNVLMGNVGYGGDGSNASDLIAGVLDACVVIGNRTDSSFANTVNASSSTNAAIANNVNA